MNFATLAARGGRLTAALAATLMIVITPWTPVRAESGEGAQGAIEELIVTARKREESVLEIPETVSVISGDAIARRDLTTLDDIGNSIANLNLSKRADGFPNVSIRGVGSFGNTQGVGFYLDDAQIFSDASSRFGDLERIEVLKGPQGVLYGGSNIGGAVKFVSRRPDSEEVSGRVKVRAGEQSIIDLEGSINVPLGDNGWAMRAFGFYNEDDGYLTNPNAARINGLRSNPDKDEGQFEEFGGRLSIAGPIGERLSVFAAMRYNEYDGPNNPWVREIDDDLDYPGEVANTLNSSHERETFAGMLELTLELDGLDVVSLTSYTDTESDRYTDVDIREEYIFDAFRPETMDVFTQEIRLTSTHDGPLQWIVGGFYSMFEETMRSSQIFFNAGPDGDGNITGPLGCLVTDFGGADVPGFACTGVWIGDDTLTVGEEESSIALPFELRNRDKSHLGGFASATYSWEAWELSAGFRVDRWKNESDNLDTLISSKIDDVEFLPRISLSRFLNEDHMLYFTFAEGFEPGGFNIANLGGLGETFEPERASSFELGWKGKTADGRLTASLAAFFIDYEGRQVEFQATVDGQLIEGINNGGDSENFGIEAEAMWRVNDWLSLTAAFGWVDAEWDDGTFVDGPSGPVDVGGTTPPVVQDVNWHLGADFQYPIGSGGIDFIASVQVNHSGEYNGLQVWDTVKNPDYTIVNAQVGLAGERWELTVNAKNLFDEDHYVDLQRFPNLYLLDLFAGEAGGDILIGTLGQPRLITGSLTYRF
ncbi:MAG: TonB-dependent receptor [Pseudomonadales bacterium]|nr:TonB-dependent receptor [Pseudomonadales bacterium]NIX09315.1 TonB-dependent receptor [Pseudomonadales bacterium]